MKSDARTASKLIGKMVWIKSKESWAHGEWGIVIAFDGENYHVAIANDKKCALVFDRSEIKVSREQK